MSTARLLCVRWKDSDVTTTMESLTRVSGLHVVFVDRPYTPGDMAEILAALQRLWNAGVAAAELTPSAPTRLESRPILTVQRSVLASPWELWLSPDTVIATGSVAGFGIWFMKKVLEKPEAVGAWLPTLVASWRKGWLEATEARQALDEAKAAATVQDTQRAAIEVHGLVESVEAIDAGPIPPALQVMSPSALRGLAASLERRAGGQGLLATPQDVEPPDGGQEPTD